MTEARPGDVPPSARAAHLDIVYELTTGTAAVP
jgi:hypothetical protein